MGRRARRSSAAPAVLHVVRGEDERAVVNTMRTENFYGGFYRGPLDA